MPPSNPHALPDTASASDDKVLTVVQALQHDIVFGRLKPRERLVEEELSARFAAGRHVIRAVLEELDRQGLVVRRPNRGAVVRDYSMPEIEQLYDMRAILQREAALRIPLPGSVKLVTELKAINAEYKRLCRTGDLYQAAFANERFHKVMFAECGNPHLADLIQQFWLKTAAIHSRCYGIGKSNLAARAIEEHKAMIDAIAGGDRQGLAGLCVSHMNPALEAYRTAFRD
jgi:DNA-binding GntR family transcriptional regulator